MTSTQSQILAFWVQDARPTAWFNGQLITHEMIKTDPTLADTYWNRQLQACHVNYLERRF